MDLELQLQLVQSTAWVLVGTAISLGLVIQPAIGVGIGQGYAAGRAVEAVGRQPEARSGIMSTLLVGDAMAETSGIYGLLLSFILIFVNPFFNAWLGYLTQMGWY